LKENQKKINITIQFWNTLTKRNVYFNIDVVVVLANMFKFETRLFVLSMNLIEQLLQFAVVYGVDVVA
jgi:hypothetical protein